MAAERTSPRQDLQADSHSPVGRILQHDPVLHCQSLPILRLVETRAIQPARTFCRSASLAKMWLDSASWETCFLAFRHELLTVAAVDPFRPCRIHHMPARSKV